MISLLSTLAYGVIALTLYNIILIVYRLYFSPIARLPGPKLAAATHWVELYYDIIRGGQFTYQIERWHEKYGMDFKIALCSQDLHGSIMSA